MPQTSYFALGEWDSVCDQCGRGFKFSDLSKRWDNAWVCDACWEPRQPQDFVRAVRDDPSVPVARPRVGLPTGLMMWTNGGSFVTFYNGYVPVEWTNR